MTWEQYNSDGSTRTVDKVIDVDTELDLSMFLYVAAETGALFCADTVCVYPSAPVSAPRPPSVSPAPCATAMAMCSPSPCRLVPNCAPHCTLAPPPCRKMATSPLAPTTRTARLAAVLAPRQLLARQPPRQPQAQPAPTPAAALWQTLAVAATAVAVVAAPLPRQVQAVGQVPARTPGTCHTAR